MLSQQKLSDATVSSIRIDRKRRAFTLVELLVVVSIIGILIGILFPALSAVRQAARQSYCKSNLRQVIIATLTHESSMMSFPAGDNGKGGGFIIPLLSNFSQEYLSQLEDANLNPGETYFDRMVEMTETELEMLICPSSSSTDSSANIAGTGDFTTHYYGVCGPTGTASSSDGKLLYTYDQFSPISAFGPIGLQGLFSPNRSGRFVGRRLKDIRDGTSYTFAVGEVSGYRNEVDIPKAGWAFGAAYDSQNRVGKTFSLKSTTHGINSYEGELNNFSFSSNHPNGAQFAFCDGAVRFVDAKVPLDILKVFSSIDEVEKPEKLSEF